MAQLIQLRQRITATETIRKTTNAMRLIAMSTHSRLRNQKYYLELYKEAADKLSSLMYTYQNNKQNILGDNSKELILVIGSQKGLCSNFNTALFSFFHHSYPTISNDMSIITIGKQITDHFRQAGIEPKAQYNEFSSSNFVAIAHDLTAMVTNQTLYHKVIILSTKPITFFIQKQIKTDLLPVKSPLPKTTHQPLPTYIWEQPPYEIAHYVEKLQIKITLQMLLFESLLAEQAARFLSMDSSTHNADNMITDMKRDYNKMRQAAITLELIDFASNFSE